jgi:hypothetical protein
MVSSMTSKITSKGQTTLPKEIRDKLARFSHRCFLRGQISGRQGESSRGGELLKK